MKFKFLHTDFEGRHDNCWLSKIESEAAAKLANSVLDKYRAEHGVVVYGRNATGHAFDSAGPAYNDTHRALLIDIEPIEVKPCEHEPHINIFNHEDGITAISDSCKHCGIKLKAKWEPAE
jgi:hypothetical protein